MVTSWHRCWFRSEGRLAKTCGSGSASICLVSFFQKGIGFDGSMKPVAIVRKSSKPLRFGEFFTFQENCDMSNNGPFFHVHPQLGLVSCDSDWHLLRENPLVDKLLSEVCISDSGSVSVDGRSTGHVNFVWWNWGQSQNTEIGTAIGIWRGFEQWFLEVCVSSVLSWEIGSRESLAGDSRTMHLHDLQRPFQNKSWAVNRWKDSLMIPILTD